MVFDFHKDKNRYFNIQYLISRDYIIPFVNPYIDSTKKLNILEIGCAEAGVLKAFLEQGHQCTGVELSENRVKLAKVFLKDYYESGQIDFISSNIYDIDPDKDLHFRYDLIILKDVIEHIPDQEKFIKTLADFLNPDGKIFFGFPPWQMPFGGHQQMCENKLASILPWYHLLPKSVYKEILKVFGEAPKKIEELLEIKDTGISIERFQRITRRNNYKRLDRRFYLVNPIYEHKFGMKPREQFGFINVSAVARNFLTTTAFYLIKVND